MPNRNSRYSKYKMTQTEFQHTVLSLSDKVYSMVRRMIGNTESAEDAVQEIMIKLWDRRKKLSQHPNIPGFVLLTTRNYCLDLLKKKHPDFDFSEYQLKMLVSENSQNNLEWKELNNIILELLKELPSQQYEVMMMRDIDGLDYTEIAEATNLKVEHIRVLLSRARKQVGAKLKNIYSYE